MSTLVFFAFFVTFMEKTPPVIKCHSVFDHFSRTYEVAKSWTIKLYLCVSDIITGINKQNVNCGLHVNFWNFFKMSFCFMMKKDHFKPKMLLWPQVPFKSRNCIMSSKHSERSQLQNVVKAHLCFIPGSRWSSC